MKKYLLSTLVVAALISSIGCKPSAKDNKDVAVAEQTEEKDSVQIFGTYKGTLPCADCSGKETSLTISEDSTYSLKYKYLGKDEEVIEVNGVYNIIDDVLVETITPSSGTKTYYKFVDGNLILSDSIGTVNDGELAEFYILKRQ